MNALGARVRLVKGAYKEPKAVAYQQKADVDAAYVRLMKTLLADGHYPAIATHDPAMIDAVARSARASTHIAADRFEFQMLYGIRRDLQTPLVRTAIACASTSRSGASGFRISCAGWASGPPTSCSSSAESSGEGRLMISFTAATVSIRRAHLETAIMVAAAARLYHEPQMPSRPRNGLQEERAMETTLGT